MTKQPEQEAPESGRGRSMTWILILLIVVIGGGIYYLYGREEAPGPVTLPPSEDRYDALVNNWNGIVSSFDLDAAYALRTGRAAETLGRLNAHLSLLSEGLDADERGRLLAETDRTGNPVFGAFATFVAALPAAPVRILEVEDSLADVNDALQAATGEARALDAYKAVLARIDWCSYFRLYGNSLPGLDPNIQTCDDMRAVTSPSILRVMNALSE